MADPTTDDETEETTPDDESAEGEGSAKKLSASQPWLSLLEASKKAFDDYQLKCDSIDKLYANLSRLASISREREFQLFWANIQVLGPSIYSRPPVPVVVPRFKDRRPIARTSSEVLERVGIVTMDTQDLDSVLINIRDNLVRNSRGVAWLQLLTKAGKDYVSVEYLNRRDYRCDPARVEKEVDWKAKCAWMTKAEARKRFYKISGDMYREASYIGAKKRNDGYSENSHDKSLKAPFWEIWSKSANKVVWVAEGCTTVLDEDKPHLELEGFFPCPKPAVGTLQPDTLIPVPDYVFYKDQLEEINEITGRIAALTDAVKVRGFYPGGAGELSDAIENAINATTNNNMLIPIKNWAMLGGGSAKDMVLWWPLDLVATVIKELIELRKQLIDDVYQITGLSDIMRGSTVASETLGAQKLKSQYGSVRIRDKQNEMTRVARDIIRIACEMIAENYSAEKVNELAQMQLPTDADMAKKAKPFEDQLKQIADLAKKAQNDPTVKAKAQQNPQQAQQVMQQLQQEAQQLTQQLQQIKETVTIDQVMKFLRDNRMRAFSLDIETDSTIQPDEDAAKQRATEYIAAMAQLMQQAIPAVQQVPQIAPLMAQIINFANGQFRVGREMASTVEEFTDQMTQLAAQPKPDPQAAQKQMDAAKVQHDQTMQQTQQQHDLASEQRKQAYDQAENTRKTQWEQQQAQNKHDETQLKTQFELRKLDVDAEQSKQSIDADLIKAKLASFTAITVANIGAGAKLDETTLSGFIDTAISQMEHNQQLQQNQQQSDLAPEPQTQMEPA